MKTEFGEGAADLSAGITDDPSDDVVGGPDEMNAEERAAERYADKYVAQHGAPGHPDDPPIDPGPNDYFGRPPATYIHTQGDLKIREIIAAQDDD